MTNDKKEEVIAEEKTKIKKRERAGLASISFFAALMDRLGVAFYGALITGFFGKLFSSYSSIQKSFEKGFCGGYLLGINRVRKFFHKIRVFLASKIETGFFINQARKIMKYFCSLSLGSYGYYFLLFGIYTIVVYLIKYFIPGLGVANRDYLVVGAVIVVVAFPMMFSKLSLAASVKKSVIGNMIFQGAFGLTDESFRNGIVATSKRVNVMMFLGLLTGLLTFVIHPLHILFGIFAIVVLCLVAASPEIGVLISIILVPLLSFTKYPTVYLCGFILITSFFYLLKVIRGKRLFKLELLDVFVLMFGFLIFCSGFFSAGKEASFTSIIVTCSLLLGYFLLVNLLRTEKWIKRCVFALVGSATLTSLIGIFEYVLGEKNSQWLDTSLFSDIKLRVVSLFENPNVLAAFTVMIFPFAIALLLLSKKRNEKNLMLLVCAAMLLCTVLTWSRGAWIALIGASLIFYVFYSRKTFRFFGSLLIIIPILPIILPSTVLNRFISVTNLFDSSISYRMYTWLGTLEMIGDYWFSGIGFGNEAFQSIYPFYSYSGMETAAHSHSLFLQILVGTGVCGLIVFLAVIFFNFQKSFEYIKAPENRESRIYVSATVSAIIAALIMGLFDYVWYNYRVFYIFWIIFAIGCAFIRVGNREAEHKRTPLDEIEDSLPERNENNYEQ